MSVNQFFREVCSALRREGFTAQPERDGLLWLNPGSCGPRRFHQEITMMTAEVEGGRIAVSKILIPHEAK